MSNAEIRKRTLEVQKQIDNKQRNQMNQKMIKKNAKKEMVIERN